MHEHRDSATGTMIAFLLIVAAIVLGFVLYRNGAFDRARESGGGADTNVNVELPNYNGTDIRGTQ